MTLAEQVTYGESHMFSSIIFLGVRADESITVPPVILSVNSHKSTVPLK